MRAVFILLVQLICQNCFAQKKQKRHAPPGTVQINDTLFADKTEMPNIGYREYLHWLSMYDSLKVATMLPDSLVWNDTLVYNENPLTQYYFRHPGFNNYPVVGVSYEQAVAYCEWRTLAANYVRHCKENGVTPKFNHLGEKFPIKFYYRLPTKQEWEMISTGKMDLQKFPYGYDSTQVKWKGKYIHRFNVIFPGSENDWHKLTNKSFYTADAKSYFTNSFKLYNTIGNIAEMVSEKGIAKGGSFMHLLEECKIANNQTYTKPERWLGFRCVAVYVK